MRLFIVWVSLVLIGCQSYAQENLFWLPERYVKATLAKDPKADIYLLPFESFYNPFRDCKILAYKAEFKPAKTKKIMVGKKCKFELSGLEYYMALETVPDSLISRLENSKAYLSKEGDKLLLEISYRGSVDRIYFIDRLGNYLFREFYKTKEYLQSMAK